MRFIARGLLSLIVAAWLLGGVATAQNTFSRIGTPIQGVADQGSTKSGYPVLMGGANGSTVTNVQTDSSGNLVTTPLAAGVQKVEGEVAAGASAASVNPVVAGGVDGSGNARSVRTDASGFAMVIGPTANGGATSEQPVLVAGSDGANIRNLLTDTSGRQIAVGAAAAGAAVAGNPILGGVSDGTNVYRQLSDNGGRTITIGAGTVGVAPVGAPNYIGGLDPVSGFLQPYYIATGSSDALTASNYRPLVTFSMPGLINGTAMERARTANAADATAGTGVPAAGTMIYDTAATVWRRQVSARNIGDTNSLTEGPSAGNMLFNGSNWDRWRNNTNTSILASASRTTTQNVTFTNYNSKGCHVVLDMTDVTAGPSVTLSIEGQDSVSAKFYTILAGAAVTTVSTNVYKVHPALTAAANAVANDILPRSCRITVTANNANAGTYSVGLALVN